jgi:hypothetical protein
VVTEVVIEVIERLKLERLDDLHLGFGAPNKVFTRAYFGHLGQPLGVVASFIHNAVASTCIGL